MYANSDKRRPWPPIPTGDGRGERRRRFAAFAVRGDVERMHTLIAWMPSPAEVLLGVIAVVVVAVLAAFASIVRKK